MIINVRFASFLTDEDVIFSSDSTSIDISKTMLTHIFNKTDIKTNDVVGLYSHGILYYLDVTSVQDKGSTYLSCGISPIDLKRTLELCNIDMGSIRLSTEFYFDKTQPKRVDNSGKEDESGIINTKCYEEKTSDGTIVYHPMAVTTQAYYVGMNADEEGAAVPGGFIGCYIGQVDESDANSFINYLVDGVKNLGKKVYHSVIEPVVDGVKGAAEILKDLAVGGEKMSEVNLIDVNKTFNNEVYELNLDLNGDDGEDEKGEGMWTKEEWENSVKGVAKVELDGHVQAKAGAYIDIEFSPLKVESFSTGVQANSDIDLDATLELGVNGSSERPVVIYRFDSRQLKFSIGPIPVLIMVYPELIWKTSLEGEVMAYAKFHTTYNMAYDAHINFFPSVKGECTSNSPKGDVKFMGAGLEGEGVLSSGLFMRTSWELYGATGPVFDFGATIAATVKGKVFVNENLEPDYSGSFGIDANLGQADISYAVKFPELKKFNEWLYEKLSWESGSLINIDPIYVIPILHKGDADED